MSLFDNFSIITSVSAATNVPCGQMSICLNFSSYLPLRKVSLDSTSRLKVRYPLTNLELNNKINLKTLSLYSCSANVNLYTSTWRRLGGTYTPPNSVD